MEPKGLSPCSHVPTSSETSSYILWKKELKMIKTGLKGHVNMSSAMIIYYLCKVISPPVCWFHLWNCYVQFCENFYWIFMFRVVIWVLIWFVSFFSYPPYTEQITECTRSVVLTDFNKFFPLWNFMKVWSQFIESLQTNWWEWWCYIFLTFHCECALMIQSMKNQTVT